MMPTLQVLLVNTHPLDHLGGAELSLKMHVELAPPNVSITVSRPNEDVDLHRFDAIILANLRPPGGVGEGGEVAPALTWLKRLQGYSGFVLRSEYDCHPCGQRNAECVTCPLYAKVACSCSSLIPDAYELLFNRCDAVQFLSPAHRQVINAIIKVRTMQVVIATPIALEPFQSRVPWHRRRAEALIVGDEQRVAPTAEARAREQGFTPVRFPYLSVPYQDMPALLNEYQAVVVDPILFHSFGRIYVEALSCGCRVLAGPRVGAASWPDPFQAVRQANDDFWNCVLNGIQRKRARAA